MFDLFQSRTLLAISLWLGTLVALGYGSFEQDPLPSSDVHEITTTEVVVTGQPQARGLEQLRVLELSEEGFDWRRDWWKYTIMILAGALVLFLMLHTMRLVIRLIITLCCVVIGIMFAKCCGPTLGMWCTSFLPESIVPQRSAQHVGYFVGFLLGYLGVSIVASLLLRPLKRSPRRER